MILTGALTLTFELTAAKTTNDFELTVDFLDWNKVGYETPPATQRNVSNGTGEVVILTSPNARNNPVTVPQKITCFNADTADNTAIIKTDDGTTETTEIRILVPVNKSLIWSPMTDWYITS